MSKDTKKIAKPVAKAAKKTTASKKAVKAKAATSAPRPRIVIPMDATIRWIGVGKDKANPFREKSEVHTRVEAVRKASGKTREAIEKLKGVRKSTIPNLAKDNYVSFK